MRAILCRRDGKWKQQLEQLINSGETVSLLAIGKVKYEVFAYLCKRIERTAIGNILITRTPIRKISFPLNLKRASVWPAGVPYSY
ncbi:hypothetical protein DRO54_09655 [Candidatus Bathyarchaeota archaeon]|nr:MAG: hypothetical protein DRO54_09655 [Candidatus Bathyarchaeota archaeon]